MRGPAHGNHGEHRDGCREEARQVQGKRHEGKHNPGEHLREHHEELLGLVKLQERAPERLQRPRKHDERGPESYLRVAHAHAFVHQRTHHVQHHERHSHGKIKGRNPCHRAYLFDIITFHIFLVGRFHAPWFYFLQDLRRSVFPSFTSFRMSSPNKVFCQANQERV